MLSDREFVTQSLELNLFFMRIAKEHSIFMEAAFTQRDYALISQADAFKNLFTQFLADAIRLSNGVISTDVINSGELITDLTFASERETEFYSAIDIDSRITRMEAELEGDSGKAITKVLVNQVTELNRKAIEAVNQLAYFKASLLQCVLSCRVFTTNYPLLIDHILREAKFYLRLLVKLQKREETNIVEEAIYQETFWNRIMAEHAKFIRGLLDPTEQNLFNTANDFGKKFDELTAESQTLVQDLGILNKVTDESLKTTIGIRDFKKQGTEGLIDCKIRSIAYPLLGDHVIREANHYIRLLKSFKVKGK